MGDSYLPPGIGGKTVEKEVHIVSPPQLPAVNNRLEALRLSVEIYKEDPPAYLRTIVTGARLFESYLNGETEEDK